jgi:hypothetical protein
MGGACSRRRGLPSYGLVVVAVKRTARAAQRPNYDTLLETLHTLCERELGGRGDVVVRRDQLMLSPRNGFISAVKASSVRVAAGSGAPLAGAGS